MNMGKVLVTGGAGYIGSHFCQLLSRAGQDLVVYDNLERGHRQAVRWGELVKGDIRDTAQLRRVINDHGITRVVHFAALAYVRESLERPNAYWTNNVDGTRSLLEAMRGSAVRHLIFSSSCATYGVPEKTPIRLGNSQHPINPYGRTKLACEWMIQDYARSADWSYTLLRYFNVAGSDPDLKTGETHDPETHIIPTILLKALCDREYPVQIFGNSHPTRDGTCVRDYIHVVDLARVHLAALEYLESGGDLRCFNVGLGLGASIAQILEVCRKVTEHDIPVKYEPPHPGDPPELIADPEDTWRELNIEPLYTQLEESVRHTWDWIRLRRNTWLADRCTKGEDQCA